VYEKQALSITNKAVLLSLSKVKYFMLCLMFLTLVSLGTGLHYLSAFSC